jgi:hypothetical protein
VPQLTHWKKLINPDYFGSYLFQPGEKKTLTISTVVRDIVMGADGKKEECTIVKWRENEKPLILNSTNGKMISKVLDTPYTEQWAGKRIVLGVQKVKAFGEVVDAVRVKDELPKQETPPEPVQSTLPPHTCADCKAAIVDSGGFEAAGIEAKAIKRYGVALCLSCAMKRAQPKTEAPPEEVPFTEPPEEESEGTT